MGDKKIDVLSDGNLRLPVSSLMNGVPKDEVDAFFTKHKLSLDALEPSCNLTLVRDGERTICSTLVQAQTSCQVQAKLPMQWRHSS